jgi:hypothetical protein
MVHEFGHALGLDHPNVGEQNCNSIYAPEGVAGTTVGTMLQATDVGLMTPRRYLWRDDIEGLRRLYNTPGVCLDQADCGCGAQDDCCENFWCDIPAESCIDPATGGPLPCTNPAAVCSGSPGWQCIIDEVQTRAWRPYYHETRDVSSWQSAYRMPPLNQACSSGPAMSTTPVTVTSSPTVSSLQTPDQLITMVDENGFVTAYPLSWDGFCEKGEYRVWPYGEGQSIYERPTAAIGNDHAIVAWIGDEKYDSFSSKLYWRTKEFNGPCEFQWRDLHGTNSIHKESIGAAYDPSVNRFKIYQGMSGTGMGLVAHTITLSGSLSSTGEANVHVGDVGPAHCNGQALGCTVPASVFSTHEARWREGNTVVTAPFYHSPGHRGVIGSLTDDDMLFGTMSVQLNLTNVSSGTSHFGFYQLEKWNWVTWPSAPTISANVTPKQWAGSVGSQRNGLMDRYRLMQLADDDPGIPFGPTVCEGANCPVNCGGIPPEPEQFDECINQKGWSAGGEWGCPCAEVITTSWPSEEGIADGMFIDDGYCFDVAEGDTEEQLVCGKAPDGYHDMCQRCGYDTMAGCDCVFNDECTVLGEELQCYGGHPWTGSEPGKCWPEILPDWACEANCSALGRSCFYGNWPNLQTPIHPAQCADPDCGPICEDQGLVCDPNTSQCVTECVTDQDCWSLNYPCWYQCDGNLLCVSGQSC